MTEEIEKQAEDYLKKDGTNGEKAFSKIPKIKAKNSEEQTKLVELLCDFTKQVFIDGAKWGMEHAIEWHDLRKNPDDLPNPNIAVLICFRFEKWTTTYIAYYRPSIKKWQIYNLLEAQREPIVDDYIDSEEVIAWCELPQFKE